MAEPPKKAVVVIPLSGSRWEDARQAEQAVRDLFGDPQWTKPRGWVWHHTGEDGKVQLVPGDLHGNLAHTGGFALHSAARNNRRASAGGTDKRQLGASPLPLAQSYPPLRPADLNTFEGLLETRLPEDYRNFLLSHNGGRPRVGGFRIVAGEETSDETLDYFLGIAPGEPDDIVTFLDRYSDRLAPNLLPIAYDAFGNLICLGLSEPFEGQILFWDHELEPEEDDDDYSNVTVVADEFRLFLESFFKPQ
jgi:hypothetical protein